MYDHVSKTPKERRKDLEDICTPIFDAPMGNRLALMRMRLLLDQGELGEKLGLAQKTVSDLECGKLSVARFAPSVAKIRDVFGDSTDFILFAANAGKWAAPAIETKFFDARHRIQRKPRIKRTPLRDRSKTKND